MKLTTVTSSDIIAAAQLIDEQGIPKNFIHNNYYVEVKGKEYPFKYLTRIAFQLNTEELLNFQSNESYRHFIEALGFKLKYYKEGINFFNNEELAFYSLIVNKEYRANNPESNQYAIRLYPIIAKVNKWAEMLCLPGFNIVKADKWLNAHSSTIKTYFWPRMYKGNDEDVFFNVEVNGAEQFIGIKLDGYYETKKKLPPYKIKILEEYKKSHNIGWYKIPFTDLAKYNWDMLLAETSEYILKYLSNHDELKEIISKEIKIARITWNTNNWVKPSGRLGKSTSKSFEQEKGYGHEEWLFSSDSIINNIKYGFLEPIHKYRSSYQGRKFDILLYTRNTETNQYYWVTKLENVEVLSEEESEQILESYKKNRWYDKMRLDLFDINLDSNHLDAWINNSAGDLFNIKFSADQLQFIPPDLIPIEESILPSDRYTLMDVPVNVIEKYYKLSEGEFSFESGSEKFDPLQNGARKYSKKEVETQNKHNEIQKKFLSYLQKQNSGRAKIECHAHGSSRIDVTLKTATGYIFFEIKAYNNLRTSIREALGQLLEYCLYPNKHYAERIVLVSDQSPTEQTRIYLNHIKSFLNIPFSYIHFDVVKEEIVEEI